MKVLVDAREVRRVLDGTRVDHRRVLHGAAQHRRGVVERLYLRGEAPVQRLSTFAVRGMVEVLAQRVV